MGEPSRHFLAVSPDELQAWLAAQGQPRYRAAQVLEWVYARAADGFEEMSNLPAALRAALAQAFDFFQPRCVGRQADPEGATEKFLLALRDGERIECVALHDRERTTFCLSVQAGCALGCRFCATGAAGFTRDLAPEEILGQVIVLRRAAAVPRNIVFMGMGEPLLNLDALLPALDALTDPRRFAMGARRITVSTAGIPAAIDRLAAHRVRPRLALSLGSPFDAQRSELMPVNRRYRLHEVLAACARYADRSGGRVSIEYVLLGGVNTSPEAAKAVADIATGLGARVNLIAMNPVEGSGFEGPSRAETATFRHILESRGVRVTERFRRGRAIAAGCGQLKGARGG